MGSSLGLELGRNSNMQQTTKNLGLCLILAIAGAHAQAADVTEHSDGYGTGFAVYILRQADVPANDPRIGKGIGWLKANQHESGRWFTRSLHQDSKHYITHAGTAFAVMAIGNVKGKAIPDTR